MTDRQKRDALLRECAKLEEAWKICAYEIDNDEILSDEEYDRQMRSAYDDYCKEHEKKWVQALRRFRYLSTRMHDHERACCFLCVNSQKY